MTDILPAKLAQVREDVAAGRLPKWVALRRISAAMAVLRVLELELGA